MSDNPLTPERLPIEDEALIRLWVATVPQSTPRKMCEVLLAEIDALRAGLNETWLDPDTQTVWTLPTVWAYAQACKTLERIRAERDKKQINHEFGCTVFASGPCTCDFGPLRQRNADLEKRNKELEAQRLQWCADPVERLRAAQSLPPGFTAERLDSINKNLPHFISCAIARSGNLDTPPDCTCVKSHLNRWAAWLRSQPSAVPMEGVETFPCHKCKQPMKLHKARPGAPGGYICPEPAAPTVKDSLSVQPPGTPEGMRVVRLNPIVGSDGRTPFYVAELAPLEALVPAITRCTECGLLSNDPASKKICLGTEGYTHEHRWKPDYRPGEPSGPRVAPLEAQQREPTPEEPALPDNGAFDNPDDEARFHAAEAQKEER